jgi:hypothetical protein
MGAIPVEVVGFNDGKIISMPLSKVDGIRQGDIVQAAHRVATFWCQRDTLWPRPQRNRKAH